MTGVQTCALPIFAGLGAGAAPFLAGLVESSIFAAHVNTRLYLDTGDLEHALFGTPPLCVNRGDGSVTPIPRDRRLERQIRRYERKIGARPWWKFW